MVGWAQKGLSGGLGLAQKERPVWWAGVDLERPIWWAGVDTEGLSYTQLC